MGFPQNWSRVPGRRRRPYVAIRKIKARDHGACRKQEQKQRDPRASGALGLDFSERFFGTEVVRVRRGVSHAAPPARKSCIRRARSSQIWPGGVIVAVTATKLLDSGG